MFILRKAAHMEIYVGYPAQWGKDFAASFPLGASRDACTLNSG